jgi:tRNA modification GTPase
VPGTTRDSIEEYADIEGIPFRLIDTAGITSSADIVEKQGIIRSREHIKNASLVMLVLDAGVPLSGEDTALLKDTEGRPRIIVINKSDLPRKIDFKAPGTVEVSAKKGYAIDKLRTAMAEAVFGGAVIGQEGCAISNLRQKEACRQAAEAASRALGAVEGGQSAELAAVDIRECLDHISEIAGETFDEDILDRVFSSFCIGK